MSLPVRGAWIEITDAPSDYLVDKSLPVRGAWIEIPRRTAHSRHTTRSLPVRGAWIEIFSFRNFKVYTKVAPRAGSVD